MGLYRCYHVGLDRCAHEITDFAAPNDVEALRQAYLFAENCGWHGVEVWEGPRKICGCMSGLACEEHSQTLH